MLKFLLVSKYFKNPMSHNLNSKFSVFLKYMREKNEVNIDNLKTKEILGLELFFPSSHVTRIFWGQKPLNQAWLIGMFKVV